MDKSAIDAARVNLAKATVAVDKMRATKSHPEFELAWSDFLMAAGRVYSKLEQGSKTKQGSKTNGRSTAWFGRQKHTRKTDPLLSYLHHARNIDEHGLEPVTKLQPGGIGIGTIGQTHVHHLSIQSDQTGRVTIQGQTSGDPLVITATPNSPRLVTVIDSGDKYEPPTEHMGAPIKDQSPVTVADLGLAFLRSMTEEAAKLA
jgi:hypothetical protein